MWRFTIGLVTGLYLGTHYDCKPAFKSAQVYMERYFPQKKDD